MLTAFDPEQHPHRRFNSLTQEWVLVSPHRTKRPWQGQRETSAPNERPTHDPECYLCPGNPRAGGARNPLYTDTFVFDNDFAALLPDSPNPSVDPGQGSNPFAHLLRSEPVQGECRVLCFSPRHDLTLPELPEDRIIKVIGVWADQVRDLGRRYLWVQVFENKGSVMGCSNPHPHGQVWAGSFLPCFPKREDLAQEAYFQQHHRPLLLDYAEAELRDGRRIVDANADWLLLVPYWATWPFEYLLLPRRHVQHLPDLTPAERQTLAVILKTGLTRYDNLFETSFPYSMGWHGAPHRETPSPGWQLHAHFLPPLLRSATVRKFMVGYEMLAEPQRDLTPEQAADRLRALPTQHYRS